MAKSKLPTPDQLKQLAAAVIDTRKNAYYEADLIGFKLDDRGWKALEKQERIFRCIDCSWWQSEDCRAYDGAERCNECEAELAAGG